MAEKLTDRRARALTPPQRGSRIIWDSEVKGFGLRITAGGARAFVVDYRNADGVQRRLTIGSYPDWPVQQARAEAGRYKRDVDLGRDPLRERQAARISPTMAELARAYLVESAIPYKAAKS